MSTAEPARSRDRLTVVRLLRRVPAYGAFGVAVALTAMLAGSTPAFNPARVPEPPADPGIVVLQLQEWKSLTPPYERAALPEFTLYGGGRVIAGGFWDGSLHRAWEYTLTPDQYRQIYRLAHAAGLAHTRYLDAPMAATDGSLLVASLWSAGRAHTTKVVSSDKNDTGSRGRIVAFRRFLDAFAVPGYATRPVLYRPTQLAVLVTRGWRGAADGTSDAPRAWPATDLLAGTRTRMGLCTVLTGSAMSTAEALGRDATLTTEWQSRGEKMLSVALRPLLPDEHDCADLDRRVP
jgi:hypothetical protein